MTYLAKRSAAMMFLLVAGCATTVDYEKTLNQWVGVRADVLRSTWGQPSSEHRSDYGGTVLEYVRGESLADRPDAPVTRSASGTRLINGADGLATETYATTTTSYVLQTGASNACTTDFFINLAGVITSWTWTGGGCKS